MVYFKKYVPIIFILLSCSFLFSFEALAVFDLDKGAKAAIAPLKQFAKNRWVVIILAWLSFCVGIDFWHHQSLTGWAIFLSLIGSFLIIYFTFF